MAGDVQTEGVLAETHLLGGGGPVVGRARLTPHLPAQCHEPHIVQGTVCFPWAELDEGLPACVATHSKGAVDAHQPSVLQAPVCLGFRVFLLDIWKASRREEALVNTFSSSSGSLGGIFQQRRVGGCDWRCDDCDDLGRRWVHTGAIQESSLAMLGRVSGWPLISNCLIWFVLAGRWCGLACVNPPKERCLERMLTAFNRGGVIGIGHVVGV